MTGELLGQTGMEWADSSLTDVINKSEQYEATNTSNILSYRSMKIVDTRIHLIPVLSEKMSNNDKDDQTR